MSTRWWACRMPITVGQLDIAAFAVAGEPPAPANCGLEMMQLKGAVAVDP